MADRQRCIRIFGAILLAAVAAAADLGPDLRDAARKGQTRQVAALLDRGAPIESADKDGRTALLYAAQRGHAETVKLLLDRGAKPDARDRQGWTAYALALLNGRDEVVKVLPPQRPVTLELVVTWAPDNLYSSCSLTPQQLADRIAALQLDAVTAAAIREYAVNGGKGAAQFPADGADATLEVKVRPGVSCLQQQMVDKLNLAVDIKLTRRSDNARLLEKTLGGGLKGLHTRSATSPAQYGALLSEWARGHANDIYWAAVEAWLRAR